MEWNIDIDKGPFGIKWGATEEEIVDGIGEPNGYFNISNHKKLMFYGKKIVFLLSRGKLKEVNFSDYSHSILLRTPIAVNSEFETANITVNGKEIFRENFKQLEDVLGIELGEPSSQAEFATNTADVYLSFAQTYWGNSTTGSYTLIGYRIVYQL